MIPGKSKGKELKTHLASRNGQNQPPDVWVLNPPSVPVAVRRSDFSMKTGTTSPDPFPLIAFTFDCLHRIRKWAGAKYGETGAVIGKPGVNRQLREDTEARNGWNKLQNDLASGQCCGSPADRSARPSFIFHPTSFCQSGPGLKFVTGFSRNGFLAKKCGVKNEGSEFQVGADRAMHRLKLHRAASSLLPLFGSPGRELAKRCLAKK